jgi:hypothetical protein
LGFERFLDRNQQQTGASQLGRVFPGGAQQISAFARSGLPQLVAIEPIAERGAVCGHLDHDQAPSDAGLIARGAEFISRSVVLSEVLPGSTS